MVLEKVIMSEQTYTALVCGTLGVIVAFAIPALLVFNHDREKKKE
jgi:hypothetical protein